MCTHTGEYHYLLHEIQFLRSNFFLIEYFKTEFTSSFSFYPPQRKYGNNCKTKGELLLLNLLWLFCQLQALCVELWKLSAQHVAEELEI